MFDHVIEWTERSLRRTLHSYFAYYQLSRTHLALPTDAPGFRTVETPERGHVVAIWEDFTIATSAKRLKIVRRCSAITVSAYHALRTCEPKPLFPSQD
jgi:hypothetical protein